MNIYSILIFDVTRDNKISPLFFFLMKTAYILINGNKSEKVTH